MINTDDHNFFLASSEKVGNNFFLTQGAGGNTSYKSGNSLFVKGSGHKLKLAKEKNIFVEVDLEKLLRNIDNKEIEPLKGTWDESKGIKPSMETSLHAILPHKYVFHVHCLNTISWVVQEGFKEKLSTIFKGFKFAIIKYAKPGLPLANEIQEILKDFVPDILFLSNHGLVVGSDNLNYVMETLNFVSNRLERIGIKHKSLDLKLLDKISKSSSFRPIKYLEAHQIAYSPESIKIISSGTLFPDHVVFLGKKAIVIKNKDHFNKIQKQINVSTKIHFLIVPNSGILVSKNISNEAEELILALKIIISKIPTNVNVNYLKKFEEDELLNSNSEKYRLKLNNSN